MGKKELMRAVKSGELAYCRKNPEYFIETYCRIEDRDAPEGTVPFLLWPMQREALSRFTTEKLCVVLKARQLGLSWLVLAYSLYRMLASPGASVAALSRTQKEAEEMVRRIGVLCGGMPELIAPAGRKTEGELCWSMASGEVALLFPDGKKSVFHAFPSAPGSVRSFTVTLLVLDEWAFQPNAHRLWASAFPAVNRPEGGQVIGLSTMRRGTLFEQIYTGENDFFKLFLPWYADPRRTEKWYEETRRQLGDGALQEYPATEEEAMQSSGGAFFPELRENIHLRPKETPAPGVRRYVAIDYGLDMLAACWIYLDEEGYARGYRELCRSGLIVSEAAEALRKHSKGEKIDRFFAPPDLWNRNRDTGKSTADIFREHGIVLTRASNSREQGWLDLKEYFCPVERQDPHTGEVQTTARLTFDRGAMPEAWRCLRAILQDESNPKDAAKEPHELTHITDALRYFAAGRPRPLRNPAENMGYGGQERSFGIHPSSRSGRAPTRGYIYGGGHR